MEQWPEEKTKQTKKTSILKSDLISDFESGLGKAVLSNPQFRMTAQRQVVVTKLMMMMCEGLLNSFRSCSMIHL